MTGNVDYTESSILIAPFVQKKEQVSLIDFVGVVSEKWTNIVWRGLASG